jgi:hypothetical protein
MARQILVALKSEDRLSQMVPYIEKIAKPGMRVVLLVRFISQPASQPSWQDSRELECPEDSPYFEGELEKPRRTKQHIWRTHSSTEEQRLSAEHKVLLALEALRKRGIEITVDIYIGSLRRRVKSYTSRGDVHLIMMRPRWELMMDSFHKAFPVFGLSKQPTFSPILVLHPSHAV